VSAPKIILHYSAEESIDFYIGLLSSWQRARQKRTVQEVQIVQSPGRVRGPFKTLQANAGSKRSSRSIASLGSNRLEPELVKGFRH